MNALEKVIAITPYSDKLPYMVDLAMATVILIKGGVLREQDYAKCIETFISKNVPKEQQELYRKNAAATLSWETVRDAVVYGSVSEAPHFKNKQVTK